MEVYHGVKQAWETALRSELARLGYTPVARDEIVEWVDQYGDVTNCPTMTDDETCLEDVEPINRLLYGFWDEPQGDSWAAQTSAFSSEGNGLPDLGAWWLAQDSAAMCG